MTVEASDVTVQLVGTDYGPAVEDPLIIRFCNDSDYTIVLECMTISSTLNWTSDGQYFEDQIFGPHNSNVCEPMTDSGFTFLLIQREDLDNNSVYISQLRVNTSTLADATPSSGQMSVTCQAVFNEKDIIFIETSGKHWQL